MGTIADRTNQDTESSIDDRFDERLSPNIRALRLTMTIADNLVSMGVAVSEVVSLSLDITETYCKRPVQVSISSSLLMFSQDRGDDREPLTLIRYSETQIVNNMVVQSIEELANEIKEKKITLADAEAKLDTMLREPKKYPLWLSTLGGAFISAGVGALLSGSYLVIAFSFVIGAIVTLITRHLYLRRIPSFFSQIFAAAFITVVASGIAWLSFEYSQSAFGGINPNLIIISGIIMLVAGLTIVGAVEDAIDEFYVTANARLLKVVMMTAGIVAGVLIGLYIAKQFNVFLTLDTERPPLEIISWQYIGAFMIAAGYALSTQTKWTGILIAGAMGLLGWNVFVTAGQTLSPVAASGLAAIAVGVASALVARTWRTPSNTLITAGIIPLVPGLTLFNGLLQIVQNSSSTGSLTLGLVTLMNAALIAVAIAAGASFGNLVARPVERSLVKVRNVLPRRKYVTQDLDSTI